jgi:hypothetical protein
MDQKVVDAARAAFQGNGSGIVLGACVHDGAAHPEPVISIPLAMMNRHGLIAGATGTGKTKTLQLIAEQLSSAGVPVFLADVKGDMSGVAIAGESSPRVTQRAADTGYAWRATSFPVEFLSLSGAYGAQLRATVSSFGPLLLARVLGLNATQSSVLSLVFKYCDDKGLLLLDLSDLRAVLQHLTGDGAAELAAYGGMSKQTVGVLLRMRARTSRSRSSASSASCAPRASVSSSSRRARRTSRPTSSASSATGCSTRCAPSRRTTRRRCAPPRAPSPRRASTTSRRRSPRSASARRW